MVEFNSFEKIKIGLASPEKIREWSYGEVKKPETINYRTQKPEKDGLFCERIFGPQRDWECHCGKYKRIRYKGVICDRCGVEVTLSKVRRERMGHIELATPVSHIWYFKGIPSRMGLLLDITPRVLEQVLYFAAYIVTDPGKTDMTEKQVLTEKEYREAREKYGDKFEAGMGAAAIKELLKKIDLDKLSEELKEEVANVSGQRKAKLIKTLDAVEAFRTSGNRPEWMILDVIPVIPPDLRPMVQLDGGRFAASDLNDLYRRVINRNNRLKKLLELHAPDIIVRNEKRMLQEAVDALIDNGRRGKPVTGPGNRPLKSLSDLLKGKQGRFRQNLLGKRVDYSGRSVIVVGPSLKLYQCGLPKEMALELFKPFVMKSLVDKGKAHNIKSAKRMVERVRDEVWDVLEEVIKDHPVLLNRAPTLHRLGIQAFEPVLVEGRALKLHPLACTAYNADFDGDQMAIHLPLSAEAQAEARFLMLSANNLLKPQDGKPVTVPTQDMILGSYYLTVTDEREKGTGKVFQTCREAIIAYENKEVGLHAPIKVRNFIKPYQENEKYIKGERPVHDLVDATGEEGTEYKHKIIDATVGQIIFNRNIPQDLGFKERKITDGELSDQYFDLEITVPVDKKMLGKIIDKCIRIHGTTATVPVLDKIKATGYKYSTLGAITVSISDMVVPKEKKALIKEAEESVENITKQFKRGLISDEERYNLVIKQWTETTDKVTNVLMSGLDKFNPIFMMANSGARGSVNQIRQLAGMRGLMANTTGKAIEIPIRANFREGLNILEYFISTRGARKGLADTALRTADSGYLTRRLVDVSQDIIIRSDDCGTNEGIMIEDIMDGKRILEPLEERLRGRYLVEDFVNPETGEFVWSKDDMITEEAAETIDEILKEHSEKTKEPKRIMIRSILGCQLKHGVCAKCYGKNLATNKPVNIGESVGIIAAQSIGEPGTQLTMRTFHSGGVAGDDITQGLPRVEELFEARRPKKLAIISDLDGVVSYHETKKKREITVTNENGESETYQIAYGYEIKVREGDKIKKGDPLTNGSIYPHDILRVQGVTEVWKYLVKEVQMVYRNQGVDINDKHIEVIVRQMMRKVKIEDNGDSSFLTGSLVDKLDFKEENNRLIKEGKTPAKANDVLLGITKASLATDSFLSAASFQETTRVLTEAAIKGKVDPLIGLKENVIIGKLIPAGTGMEAYKNFGYEMKDKADLESDNIAE